MIRAYRVWRATCGMCGTTIQDSDLSRLREIECEDWECIGGVNYCVACSRAAKLAAEGETAFEAGGQEWANWNAEALDFGD